MYAFYCVEARAVKPMCKHHALMSQLAAVKDATERKAISDEVKGIISSARTQSGSSSPFAKDYAAMKMAYCATNPPGSKVLCSTAASRYSGAPTGGTRVSSTTSKAMEWYCAKPSAEPQVCKRYDIMKKMRASVAVEEKTTLSAQLKQYPSVPYGTTQANAPVCPRACHRLTVCFLFLLPIFPCQNRMHSPRAARPSRRMQSTHTINTHTTSITGHLRGLL